MPLTWDEVPTVDPADVHARDGAGPLRAAIGDAGAGIDDAVGSLEALLELVRGGTRRRARATPRGRRTTRSRRASRRASSPRERADRRPSTSRDAAWTGGPPPEVAAERAAAVAAGDPDAGLPTEWEGLAPDADRAAQDVDPGHRDLAGRSKADALEGLERWKARHPGVGDHLEPADVLVDGMRGRSSLWYRVRVNLTHVPEADRPAQEALDPDYDPWAGYEWPDRAGQLERAPRKRKARREDGDET